MKFRVGMWVKPSMVAGDDIPAYKIKAIHADGMGVALLEEPGGYGYASYYCKHVVNPRRCR